MADSKQAVTPLATRKVQIFSNQSSLLTRAKARMTRSKLVSPLRQFTRRRRKEAAMKKRALTIQSPFQPVKDVKYFSSESSEGEELSLKPSHVSTSKLRWADYPSSSSKSLLPALVTEATSGDLDALLKAMEGLRKAVAEKDAQIKELQELLAAQHLSKQNNQAASSSIAEKALENKEDSLRTSDRGKQVTMEESLEQQKQEQLDRTILQGAFRDTTHATVASLTFPQLKLLVDDVIRARQGGTSQSSLMYAKPYTRRIDNLSLPDGYQPPKFQKFNRKGNPRQHVAHFVETCNNAGTYGDLMLEREFLTRFYNTKRTVSLPELANTKQKKDESVIDFVERWRNLVLNCREKISEISSIDMCVQGMHWGLLYNLQANMPHTFEELATRAHDLEIQIARHGNFLPTNAHDKKESRKDVKKEVKPSKAKETMAVTTAPVKISQQKPKPNPKQGVKIVEDQGQKKKSTLKELQQKEYPFADSEVPAIFEQLLALNLIELPAPKRPEEVGRVNDPKYCKYHQIVSHPIGKCFVLKDLIVRLEKEGKIQLESEEGSVATNVAMVSFGSFNLVPLLLVQPTPLMVQPKEFGPHLPKGATPAQGGNSSSLSLYDLMTVNLEDWESSSESEAEVGDGWSTFISKSKKHCNPVSSGMPLPDPHKIMYGIYPEIKPTGWCSNSEFPAFDNDDDGWIPVQSRRRRHHSRPTLPSIQQNHSFLSALPVAPKNQEQRQLVKRSSDLQTRLRQVPKKRKSLSEKDMNSKERAIVTLYEYFPEGYFFDEEVSVNVTSFKTENKPSSKEEAEGSKSQSNDPEADGSIEKLKQLPSDLQLSKALQLSWDTRLALVQALLDPKKFQGELAKPKTKAECLGTITFTDEDLIGITVDELTSSKLLIQGFNQKGQRAIGKIRINFQITDMATSALFHVIEAKTSYELLLGRTWIHENGVPFTKEESHFADAKFYEKEEDDFEALPIKMPQIKQKNDGKIVVHPIKDPSSSSEVHLSVEDVKVLKEDLVLPLSTLSKLGISNPFIKEMVETAIEHEKQPQGWFDPRAQMLLKRAGFREGESRQLGDLNSILTSTQATQTGKEAVLRGEPVPKQRHGLGFQSSKPAKIKIKKKSANPITIQIFETNEVEGTPQLRPSVFSRLGAKQQNNKKTSKSQKVQKNKHKSMHRKKYQWRRKDVLDGQEISKPSVEEVKAVESNHVSIEKISDSNSSDEEPNPAPEAFEEGGQATTDELKQRNLGTEDDPRPIFLSASLSLEEEVRYVQLLDEYKDVFAWSYKEMPGLAPKVAVHCLAVKHGVRPMKQSQQRFRPDLIPQIEVEVDKLIEAGFIREVYYPSWIVNIVPVRKKNGQLRVCVDFRDLNQACPKDDFLLPIIELMVDATMGHEVLSFMDGFSGYNQIRMDPKDEELTAFRTPKDPLKYIMSRPVLSGRLAKWALLLSEFEIIYVPQKAVKGQALADFLADHPIPAEWELSKDLPDEEVFFIDVLPSWELYFDRASRRDGAGVGVVFVTPKNEVIPFSFSLREQCSNNVAEYQALIASWEMALEMKIYQLNVYGDSSLVVNQLIKEFDVRKPELVPYFQYASQLLEKFDHVSIAHIARSRNKQADALANLAAVIASLDNQEVTIFVSQRWISPHLRSEDAESNVVSVCVIEKEDWRQPIINYLEHGKLPDDPRPKSTIRRRALRFVYFCNTLYRRSFDGVLLRCLDGDESSQVVEEAHSGICGAHQSGPKLHYRIRRMGYYWPTMVKDCMEYAKKCEACQFHANFIHQPPEPLHPTIALWPFHAWGLDVIGRITPKSSAGHAYILAATNYFSKWAEAVPLREVKKENVGDFIRVNIIYRYGVPRYIITDNGKPFSNSLMDKLCSKFKFAQHFSSMYNVGVNGLAKAFNKTLCNLLKKVVSKSKRDWHERIGEALWAYRTTHCTPTKATPYSLVYGVEAVLPLECQILSLRIAIQEGLTDEQNAKLRLQELEALDEKRLETQQHLECYQARLSRAFNKKVRLRAFQVGDVVLAVRRPIVITRHSGGKFTSKWDGPYIVTEVYSNGAYKIIDKDGLQIGPINGKFLKKFYS
ncbi:hypothetical protein SLEP1_g17015 [Rubroshorea leprosula]|uniref:Uncharacterized protein n=1 Tax=Rubroshorea leprosula TaxID=152421 RepID=A0AAV5IWJ6_9ROSI|nr:hypothetical protein SLEP1_g17015 [Rubroshorea leprosula]